VSKKAKYRKKPQDLKVLDTFAGAGGFSLGFHLAGAHIVGTVETDEWACSTFQYNHPDAKVLKANIEQLSDREIIATFGGSSKPNILLGGPPCQGFSVCRKDAGDPHDPRNSLFMEFLRFADVLSPSLVIMENVPNLIKAKTKHGKMVIDVICQEMKSLGYDVQFRILDATSFGIPQIRRRLFVVGSKIPLKRFFPEPTHYNPWTDSPDIFNQYLIPCPSLWDAISDLPKLDAREGAEELEYDQEAKNDLQASLRDGSTKLFNHKAMNHSPRVVARFKAMKPGESVSDVPDELKPYRRNSNGTEIGAAYDQNNRRMKPNRPCHTIPASFYANFVHPYQHRNFTAREGARIQTFPDWYKFLGKPTVVSHKLLAREGREEEKFLCQYSQIGNAVPPFLARAIAMEIISNLQERENESTWRQPASERTLAQQVL
jgi:DNA (cytosine-5)-methyltransferase 1